MNRKKILSIILSFAILLSIIPMYNWKIVHASITHEPFIENEYEDVTILEEGIEGDITVEEAREILSDIYGSQYAYLYDNSFERKNGEKFYCFRIRWFVEDHYSTITGVFLSFDGKICVEGEYSGTRIMAYNNINKITTEDDSNFQKSIVVFTTEKSMKVKTGKSMWMGFGLLNEDSGLLDNKWKKMSVVVSDSTVVALSDYTETEYGYSLEITGKKQGATNITITDTETGIDTIITVFVQDNYANTYSYAIDNIASFYPSNAFEGNIETNIYDLNGLYVNKYQCTKSMNTYNISFDVYNSKYYSGAIDIYDENGMWLGYEEISKYSDISSLWDTGEQAYFLISDTTTGKMLTYEQASISKYTHIDIEVPEGGYFTISNNVSESPGTFFVNAFEILFDGASTAFDLFASDSVKDSALTDFKKEAKKAFATRLIEARNEGLKNQVKRNSQKIMIDSMQSEIRKITKNFTKKGLKDRLQSTDDEYSEMANLAENMLKAFDIKWKNLFESATGIGESYFTNFAGQAGIALKGCFALNGSTNKILMATQMAASTENPYVTVYSSIETGYINPYGIIVNTNGNIDAESVLQVFRISNSDVIEILLDSDNLFEDYELYNICFVKNDKLVQPNGKVTVQIPIPQGMKSDTCKVYRQESDGAWTILDAKVQGSYLVFETEHFSLYAVVGENDALSISSVPKKTNYKEGEILDTNGLVLELNGQLITEGYICEPTVLSGNGRQFVKVIYGHSVTKFEVNVEKIEIPTNTPQITANPTEAPKPTSKPSDISSSASSMVSVGKKFKVDSAQYKITSVGTKRTVEYVKTIKKNIRVAIVPAEIKYQGALYKVTVVSDNAFCGCKKLKSVDLGKNVIAIGKKAFYGCKKLKSITIKTKKLKSKSIGTQAFKGIHKKAVIEVPKKQKKTYKKWLQKKGLVKSIKIK